MKMSGIDKIFQTVDRIVLIGRIVIIAIIVLGAVALFLFYKRYKTNKRQKLTEEEFAYAGLNRINSRDYCKFDDITDNMIISDNFTKFIGGITCQGFDFYHSHISEKANCQNGYRSFIMSIKAPIAYRQHSQERNLENIQEVLEQAYKKRQEELFNLNEERKEEMAYLRKMEDALKEKADESKEYLLLLDTIEQNQKKMEKVMWRINHIEDQLAYLKQLSGGSTQKQDYFFEWIYNPADFPVDLSKEEIFKRAQEELSSMAEEKIHALSNAGVKARRITTAELTDKYYRHFHPYTSRKISIEKLADGFDDVIITTERKDDIAKEYADTIHYETIQNLTKTTDGILYDGEFK